jgi:5-methylcytosine-specific restriction endonuclease McrA
MLCRCLVLNQSYEFLEITSWYKAICHVIEGKATALAEYDDVVRSQYQTWNVPSVIVTKEYKQTKKKHSTFCNANKRNLLVRDNWKCCYCGCKLSLRSGTVEHLVPTCKGGKNTLENTAIACKSCNNLKGDMSLHAFEQKFGYKLNVVPRALLQRKRRLHVF